ncbi:MAG: ferrous iron transport protein B [Mariprofundaceae bacterium]|nr:ferrous iron transport protein B [Mariprofundaceae bacterium]
MTDKLLQGPFFRGSSKLRIALTGQPNCGKTTLFKAVSSTSTQHGKFTGTNRSYNKSHVQIDMDEVKLLDMPGMVSLRHLEGDDLEALKYLLWGDARPLVSQHEHSQPPAPFSRPDILIHVIDASVLQRSLELTLELSELGIPMVIALNMMDQARAKGMHIDTEKLSRILGVPIVETVAIKGHGISQLFTTAITTAHRKQQPQRQRPHQHIQDYLDGFMQKHITAQIKQGFLLPKYFLCTQLIEKDPYFSTEMKQHYPDIAHSIESDMTEKAYQFPRSIADEIKTDRQHRATELAEQVCSLRHYSRQVRWEDRWDAFFLDPNWGLLGSLSVFTCILFMVFEVSALLDSMTAAKLNDLISTWQPTGALETIGRAVIDGLIGLIGIVIPYMIPLVLMLVVLERSGIMQRIAFVLDRFFHHLGLHGKVAFPFLLGLGCNVPAIAATHSLASKRDRIVSSLLITFVPCSARSAIILALGAKYLGAFGVFAILMLNMIVIACLSRLLTLRYPETSPGLIQDIPPYRLPSWQSIVEATWHRTKDVLTIVTPLLVGGSILLALLQYHELDHFLNQVLSPITVWALGLPQELGVPIVFGVLRKELSLLMMYQALGTEMVMQTINWIQLSVFLVFLNFYIPCISTFAIMLKVIGRKEALFSIVLSMSVALALACAVRLILEIINAFL